jgi:hypothetical protein
VIFCSRSVIVAEERLHNWKRPQNKILGPRTAN